MRIKPRIPKRAVGALAAIIVIAGAGAVAAQTRSAGGVASYWQQQADYTIKVTLDTKERALAGTETILYTNSSPDTLKEFYLHLYPNAFRDKTSPLIRDYLQGTLYFFVGLPKSMRGWLDVSELKVNGAEAQFKVDGTILSASLPTPLTPGGTATFELSFKEKIMPLYGRSGYSGDQYDIAQWYPKMAVYDTEGWHPDQYRMGEFYGEFGDFDVHITLPAKYVIAATGVPVAGDPGWKSNALRRGDGGAGGGHPGGKRPGASKASGTAGAAGQPDSLKTVQFHAENVHDFAWCASPTFVVQDTLYNNYRVMSFFNPWNRAWADTMLAREIRSMRWLEEVAGPYPYPQVTVVDCRMRGGMEYPMLAMNGSADEGLALHELAHNYFYGILANDERAEAWLDEGFAQYMVFSNAAERFGPYGKPEKRSFPRSLFREQRMWDAVAKPVVNLHRTDFAERVATPAHEFKNGFSTMPYVGAPLFLRALRYTVGDENFRKIIRVYVDRWKFRHVDEDAFRSVCEEVSGLDLSELFVQWLHTTKDCDYRVARFKVKPAKEGFSADLRVQRKGELMMPLTLAFRLKNGNTVTERLDGISRSVDTSFTFESKPVSAAINPDNEILDIYQLDNYAPHRRGVALDVPFNTYYPPDAYQYRLLPIGYYNDIDGGKLGLRVRGSYDNCYRKFTLQGLYGFESKATDVYGAYEAPLGYFGKSASIFADAFIREGRQGASFDLRKIRRKSLFDPLSQRLSFHIGYHEISDTSYVFPNTYEKGRNLWGGLGFEISPKTDLFASSLALSYDRSLWWSDLKHETFTMTMKLWPAIRFMFPLKPDVRVFYGHAAIDPPPQGRFNLAGANALAKERFFWLRSVGAFPKDNYSNFHVAGDANLRGYFDGAFAFKSVFASNVELELPFPLPVSRSVSRTLDRRLSLFFDWGKVLDKRPLEGLAPGVRGTYDENAFDNVLTDFGFSVSLWKLTAEFPLYLSNPTFVGDTDKWDFRWTIGFNRLF
jgi:hypothetical protein